MQGQAPSPQLESDIARLEKEIELYSQEKLCYEAQILRVWISSLCAGMGLYVGWWLGAHVGTGVSKGVFIFL